jgi:hypothetical protein
MHSHLRGSDGSVFFARRARVRCQGLQPLVRGDLSLPSFPPGRADERCVARRPCREENETSGRPIQGLKSLARFVRPPDESRPCPHAKHGRSGGAPAVWHRFPTGFPRGLAYSTLHPASSICVNLRNLWMDWLLPVGGFDSPTAEAAGHPATPAPTLNTYAPDPPQPRDSSRGSVGVKRVPEKWNVTSYETIGSGVFVMENVDGKGA